MLFFYLNWCLSVIFHTVICVIVWESLCWKDFVVIGTVTVPVTLLLSLWNVNISTTQTVCLSAPQWDCCISIRDTANSLKLGHFGIYTHLFTMAFFTQFPHSSLPSNPLLWLKCDICWNQRRQTNNKDAFQALSLEMCNTNGYSVLHTLLLICPLSSYSPTHHLPEGSDTVLLWQRVNESMQQLRQTLPDYTDMN